MRQASDPSLRMQILLSAGCFLASLVYQAISMQAAIGLYDEGIILFGARRVMDGDLIHRDFYSNYGPGQFYALAALFELFSPSVMVERLWDNFVSSYSVAVVCLIVARTTRSIPAALCAGVVCMIWFGFFGFYGYPLFPAFAAALTGLLCLLSALNARHPARPLLAAGFCVGVGFLFRYDIGIFTAAALAAVVGLHAALLPSSGRQRYHSIATVVGPFAAGFTLVAVPVIGAFISYGAISDLLYDVVTVPSEYYYKSRSLPFPNVLSIARQPIAGLVYLPLLLVAAVTGTLTLGQQNQQTLREGSAASAALWAQIALIALALLYFVKGMVRVSPIHMSMAIISAVVLAVIAIANAPAVRGARRTVLVGALALVAASTFGVFLIDTGEASRNLRAIMMGAAESIPDLPAESFQTSCNALTGLQHLGCYSLDLDHLNALGFLRAHTLPGDYIYVGLGRHDKIFVNDVALYYLAKLRSSTKWAQFDPGLQTSAPIQREMISELQRNPPRYVVLESQWDAVQEPNASAKSTGIVLLDDYIRQNFHLVVTFGTITVLEQGGSPCPVDAGALQCR
jgi:hypothetical protein